MCLRAEAFFLPSSLRALWWPEGSMKKLCADMTCLPCQRDHIERAGGLHGERCGLANLSFQLCSYTKSIRNTTAAFWTLQTCPATRLISPTGPVWFLNSRRIILTISNSWPMKTMLYNQMAVFLKSLWFGIIYYASIVNQSKCLQVALIWKVFILLLLLKHVFLLRTKQIK